MVVHRRADVDAGDRGPQRHQQSAGSFADDDRPAVRSRFHVGAAVWLPRGQGLRREICTGVFGGRTASDAGRTRVHDVHEHERGGRGGDVAKLLHQCARTGWGLLNAFDATGYTVNKAPDIIIKAAADPGYGHYELFGIISTFRNRIFRCAVVGTNAGNTPPPAVPTVLACPVDGSTAPSALGAFDDTRTGGGLGASLRVPLFNKKLDFGVKGVAGDGIGRYGSAQLADETFRPDGSAALIRTAHGLGVLEFHPNPKLEVYAYYGSEYAFRAGYSGYSSVAVTATPAIPAFGTQPAYPGTTKTTILTNGIGGYGSPFANNSQCSLEKPPTGSFTPATGGTCAGDIRIITEGTLGFWHKLYNGPKGGVRW